MCRASACSVYRRSALEIERHLRIPHRPEKEKADIADRGHRKAHVRRDQNAHSNTGHKKRPNAEDKVSSRASRGNCAELSVVLYRETGKSSSGKDDRPLCFDCMRGACSRGRDCDYCHPLRSRDFKSEQYKGKKKNCPLVHSHERKRPQSLRRRSRGNATSQEGSTLTITHTVNGQPENPTLRDKTFCRRRSTVANSRGAP